MGCGGSKDETKPQPVAVTASEIKNVVSAPLQSQQSDDNRIALEELRKKKKAEDEAAAEKQKIIERESAKLARSKLEAQFDEESNRIVHQETSDRSSLFSNLIEKQRQIDEAALERGNLLSAVANLEAELARLNEECDTVIKSRDSQLEAIEREILELSEIDDALINGDSSEAHSDEVYEESITKLRLCLDNQISEIESLKASISARQIERDKVGPQCAKIDTDIDALNIDITNLNNEAKIRSRSPLNVMRCNADEILSNQREIDLLCDEKNLIKHSGQKGMCRQQLNKLIECGFRPVETEADPLDSTTSNLLNASFASLASTRTHLSSTFRSDNTFLLSYLSNCALNNSITLNGSLSRTNRATNKNACLQAFSSVTITKNPLKNAGYEHYYFPTARVKPGGRLLIEWSYDVGKSGEVCFGVADANSPSFLGDLGSDKPEPDKDVLASTITKDSTPSYPKLSSSVSLFRFDTVVGDDLQPLESIPVQYGHNKAGTGRRHVMLVDLQPRDLANGKKIAPPSAFTENITPNLRNVASSGCPLSPPIGGENQPISTLVSYMDPSDLTVAAASSPISPFDDQSGHCYFFSSSDGSTMNMKPMCDPIPIPLTVGTVQVEDDFTRETISKALSVATNPTGGAQCMRALALRHYIPYLCLYYGGESVTVHSIICCGGGEHEAVDGDGAKSSTASPLSASVRSSKSSSPTHRKSKAKSIPAEYEAMIDALWE